MTEQPISTEPASGLEDKVAKVINTVMAAALVLAFTAFALWSFVSTIGPALAVFDALPVQAQQTLGRLWSSFAVCFIGMGLLWRLVKERFNRRPRANPTP